MPTHRRLRPCLLILLALIVVTPLAQQETASGHKLAMVGGMLLDGYAAPPLHHAAILIEGDRIVQVKVGSYFTGGIDTEEQLDAALGSLRDECLHHIGKNKRILIQ